MSAGSLLPALTGPQVKDEYFLLMLWFLSTFFSNLYYVCLNYVHLNLAFLVSDFFVSGSKYFKARESCLSLVKHSLVKHRVIFPLLHCEIVTQVSHTLFNNKSCGNILNPSNGKIIQVIAVTVT